MRRAALVTLAALLLAPTGVVSELHPTALGSLKRVEPPAQSTGPTLADLAFMRGCWEGSFESRRGAGTIEEFYTSPSANIIVGTTRYNRDGRTVQFEFSLILADSSGILLRPYPGGRASADDFRLTELKGGRAVFESPEHDYPKRIIYWTEADGTRVARIDGGTDDPGGSEWRMRPVPCPAAATTSARPANPPPGPR